MTDWFTLQETLLNRADAFVNLEELLATVSPLSPMQLSHVARLDQKQRWRNGDRCLAEAYLQRFPAIASDHESTVDLIYHEYLLREKYGELPVLDDFLQRFPTYGSAIENQIRMHEALRSLEHQEGVTGSASLEARGIPAEGRSAPGDDQRVSTDNPNDRIRRDIRKLIHAEDPDTMASSIVTRTITRLGKYELLQPVGVGSFGTVYRARDRELDRIVAIKIPRLASHLREGDFERFQREARNVARLRHPSIVPVFEIGEHEGTPYLVTEFVQGMTLADQLKCERPDHRQAAEILAVIADVVHYAHENKVVHRDIKPENIMVDEHRSPRLMDFGLARRDAGDVTMTLDGQVLGTPAYMSPEQARGEAHAVDGRTDVYSLGVILYELLTGEMPFRGTSQMVLHQVLHDEPRMPRSLNHWIPHDLETICLRAMAKDAHRRFATARDLADDLRRFLRREPILARPIRPVERMGLWCRRNPTVATLSVGLIVVILAAIAGVTMKWREAMIARNAEQSALKEAVRREMEVRDDLRRLRRATELLDRGRQFLEWRRWDDAGRCFGHAIDLRDDFAPSWDQRGMMYARLGLWELAAADRARAFLIQPPEATSETWWAHAVLYAYVGDLPTYKNLLHRMRDEFRGAFLATVGSDVARVACLVPAIETGIDPDECLHLAESARLSINEPGGRMTYVAGLAAFRAGHFARAVEQLEPLSHGGDQRFTAALCFPILAMAYHHLERLDEAKSAFAACEQINDQWIQQAYDQQMTPRGVQSSIDNAWPIPHMEFLEFQQYRREAHKLLGAPIQDDYRLIWLRGQALTSLDRRADADEEFITALQLVPQDRKTQFGFHRNRAYLYASSTQYELAAQHFAAAAERTSGDSSLLRQQAICLALLGDARAYRRACSALLEQFGQSSHQPAVHDVVEACILGADAIPAKYRLPEMAEFVQSWYFDAARMRGAALCRAGRFAESIACFEAVAKLHGLRAWDWAFLSIAHQQLHHTIAARHCLERAHAWIREADHRTDSDLFRQTSWDDWYERPVAIHLADEANALIAQYATQPATP